MASVGYMSAQSLVQHNQEATTSGQVIKLERPESKADYVLKYYTGTLTTVLGWSNVVAGTYYASGCINFTAAQMFNYIGGELTQISFPLSTEANNPNVVNSGCKVWIKGALDGAILYEQNFIPTFAATTGNTWNDIILTTPHYGRTINYWIYHNVSIFRSNCPT
jgi:hypothetical protein